jgi:hypothetical protein
MIIAHRSGDPNRPMIMTISAQHAGGASACPDDNAMIIAMACDGPNRDAGVREAVAQHEHRHVSYICCVSIGVDLSLLPYVQARKVGEGYGVMGDDDAIAGQRSRGDDQVMGATRSA